MLQQNRPDDKCSDPLCGSCQDKGSVLYFFYVFFYLMTFSALRSMVSATKIRKITPLMSCWVAES